MSESDCVLWYVFVSVCLCVGVCMYVSVDCMYPEKTYPDFTVSMSSEVITFFLEWWRERVGGGSQKVLHVSVEVTV